MTGAQKIERCRRIVADWTAATIDGVLMDAFTANHLLQVHDLLSEENRAKFVRLAERDLVGAVDLMWKLVAHVGKKATA